MSLSRGECYLQDSRGSVYCASEPDPASRVQYESGRFVHSQASIGLAPNSHRRCAASDANSTEIIEVICEPPYSRQTDRDGELPLVACSQPPAPSLLTECQQSSGSLFSVVSAPPVPLAELDAKQMDTLGVGLQPGLGQQMGGSAQNPFISTHSTVSINDVAASAPGSAMSTIPRRPVTLPIDAPYCPAPPSRTLHASLLEHQISEIEEDDNENLLTVSSITARPLIAKSRELRTSRNLMGGNDKRKRGKASVQKTNSGVSSISSARDRLSSGHPPSSRSSISTDPPDGGYGWFIVFGAFSVQFWVAGLVKSYGVLYVEIMETFPSSTATVASWIPAILSALCLALAPVSSALCQRFSCRTVVFVGGLFCALGMTLSYFATSLLHLLFTFGILTGIGGGLSTTPGIVIVSQYFDKHRALANGICVSGTATGSFILPVLIKHLAEKFGFHGTILVLGFCMLDVCISALLYRPLEAPSDEDKICEEESTKPLNDINPSNIDMLTNSTYLDTCDDGLNTKFIEHLFMEESKNRLNDYYNNRYNASEKSVPNCAQESDDEVKDIIGETTFIKPMKKVRSSGIMHSVEDLSTTSTWMYRKNSGSDSNRGSRRRRNVFANDEIIAKIQAHLEKPLSPPTVVTRGLSKSMDIPTPISSASADKNVDTDQNGRIVRLNSIDEDEIEIKITCVERIKIYLDISLLKDVTFILMCLSVTLMSVGCPYMLYYLPAHVISIGYNKSEAGYLVTVSAVLDLVGRLGLGYLSDLQLFDRRKIYIVCIFGAGLAVLTIPSEDTIYLVGLSAAIYGFCLGSWYVLMPVLLADIFGTDRISSSYGLVRMFQSIGAISVPPLAGFLRDLSGSYAIVFYCMGSCMVLGCVPLLIWAFLDCRERRLYEDGNDNEDTSSVGTVLLYGIPIVSLYVEGLERLCLAQISNILLKQFSYNEIHNRRVALGITCVQCTPVQLEILRRAGAMPVSSRRCGMITRREAERLCKSFIGDNTPPRLPENFSFSVQHKCAWGCQGAFIPIRYNSSRAKCIKCNYCGMFFSPNKFIFHSHRIEPTGLYVQPDAANFNSWRRHLTLAGEPSMEIVYMWEDVKAMFNGGTRKRLTGPRSTSYESRPQMLSRHTRDMHENELALKNAEMLERDDSPERVERKSIVNSRATGCLGVGVGLRVGADGRGGVGGGCIAHAPFDYISKDRHAYELCDKQETTPANAENMLMKDSYMPGKGINRPGLYPVARCHPQPQMQPQTQLPQPALTKASSFESLKNVTADSKHNTITFSNTDTSISMQCASQSAIISSNLSQFLRTSAFKPVLRTASQATVTLESIGLTISQITPPLFCLNISAPSQLATARKDVVNINGSGDGGGGGGAAGIASGETILDLKHREDKYYSLSPDVYGESGSYYNAMEESNDDTSMDDNKEDSVIDIETSEDDDKKPLGLLRNTTSSSCGSTSITSKLSSADRLNSVENNNDDVYIDVVNENGDTINEPLKPLRATQILPGGNVAQGLRFCNDSKCINMSKISGTA